MRIAIVFLSMIGSALSQEWYGGRSHGPPGQVTAHTELRPLWSPSSTVHHSSWSDNVKNSHQDQRNTLDYQLSFTGPMVFPPGHEGMFHIPPAPHHLPRPAGRVQRLQHHIQRVSASAPQPFFQVAVGAGNVTENVVYTTSFCHGLHFGQVQPNRFPLSNIGNMVYCTLHTKDIDVCEVICPVRC